MLEILSKILSLNHSRATKGIKKISSIASERDLFELNAASHVPRVAYIRLPFIPFTPIDIFLNSRQFPSGWKIVIPLVCRAYIILKNGGFPPFLVKCFSFVVST